MSRQNVETARACYDSFNRGDLEATLANLHPEIEWHQFTQFPDREVYRGRDEMRDRFINSQLVEQFGDIQIEVEELIDAGDSVGVIGYVAGHGEASGLEFRMRLVNILEFRDALVFRAYDLSGMGEPY